MAFNAPSITQLGHIGAQPDKGRMRESVSLLGKAFGDFGMKGLPSCYVLFCDLMPGLPLAEDCPPVMSCFAI